jgi:hypothetical protein
MLEQQILQGLANLQFLKAEARRKKRSKIYTNFSRNMLAGIASAQIGPLSRLTVKDLPAFKKLLNGIVDGMAGKATLHTIEGKAFVSLQKKLFIQPSPRGPKPHANLKQAFSRWDAGEPISNIARDMEPELYAIDPLRAMDRIWKGIDRRKKNPGLR